MQHEDKKARKALIDLCGIMLQRAYRMADEEAHVKLSGIILDLSPPPERVGEGEGLKYSPGGVPYVVPPCTCTAMSRTMPGHSRTCPAYPGNCLAPHGLTYSCRYCHAASDKWWPCEHCYPTIPEIPEHSKGNQPHQSVSEEPKSHDEGRKVGEKPPAISDIDWREVRNIITAAANHYGIPAKRELLVGAIMHELQHNLPTLTPKGG